jgi:hypothetical protein
MDKLIELLREFPSNDAKVLDKEDSAIIDTWQEFVYWTRIYLYETIISKKFGFIKRLVDNDKIDKVKQVIKDIDIWGSDTITWVDTYSDYESLLMLLAIQENSIEFLISILK